MTRLFPKILATEVETSPFPHLVVDDMLEPGCVERILAHWPARSAFRRDKSNYTLHFPCGMSALSPAQRAFWSDFFQDTYAQIVHANFALFKPVFDARFGEDLKDVFFCSLMLMEADRDSPARGVISLHTYHYHDPLWLFTVQAMWSVRLCRVDRRQLRNGVRSLQLVSSPSNTV